MAAAAEAGTTPALRRRTPRWLWLGSLAVALAGLFAAGFVAFAVDVSLVAAPADPNADAIVVLTGDTGRVEGGLRLLAEGSAAHMLVSGVGPDVTKAGLARAASPERRGLFACCVELGREARNTIGNASEAGLWAAHGGFASLIVVTSDYHMPRSLIELRREMPGVRLVPYPVADESRGLLARLADPHAARLLFGEYVKYLGAQVRLLVGPAAVPAPAVVAALPGTPG